MYTPDYDCETYTAFEIATCEYYQDLAITHYYFIGYLEMLLVVIGVYAIVYLILWRWVLKPFFIR